MQIVKTRRRKRRKGTLTPRFGPSSVALEIGLIRQTLDVTSDSQMRNKKDQNRS